tara:strand:- start:222 stop:749 length:528 start_codon:yes stop_codon:yes gene_type:complete
MRNFVRRKIAGYFPEKPEVAENIEKSMYNFAIRKGKANGIVLNWANPTFKQYYKQSWITVNTSISNPKNTILRSDILSGKLSNLKTIAFLPPDKLWPNGPYATELALSRERSLKKDIRHDRLGPDYEGMFECSKCRRNKAKNTKKTTYYQMQTRSADEPMTTFVACHECGNTWKF